MAKICTAERANNQWCKNCKWHQIDDEESCFYGEYRYACFAEPDQYGYVKWEDKNAK